MTSASPVTVNRVTGAAPSPPALPPPAPTQLTCQPPQPVSSVAKSATRPAGNRDPGTGTRRPPDPRSRIPDPGLKAKSQRQLHHARIAGQRRDHAGVVGGNVRRRQAEVRAIEDVEDVE